MSRARILLLADLVVVLTLAGTALVQLWADTPAELEGGRAVHSVLVAGFTLPLLLRRRYAALVFVLIIASAWMQLELGGGLGQPFFAGVLALYSLGAHASSPSTYLGPTGVALQIGLIDVPRLRDGTPIDEVVPAWFILLAIWGFGRWMRRRASESAALRERTEAAEREQLESARRAVADERARIARELHDLVAHSMGVIVIQAQGAQRAIDASPERAKEALASIENAGRGGMAEMRRLLGLLTETDDADTTSPQPGLGQLPDLLDRVRATGLSVDLAVEGDVRPLPAGLELTGYRIVQEAITNVLKHAGSTTVDVRVSYQPDSLDIDVRDHGRGSGSGGTNGGHGLVGMRERVGLYGGSVTAGPRPEGGFSVRARIPVDGAVS